MQKGDNNTNMNRKEKKSGPRLWLELFLTFFKIGLFTFGGGYAMIPLIQRETVVRKKWVSEDDIVEIIAIAESTPGPISVNASTFIGSRTGGFFGALFATLGLVLPSFGIIFGLTFVLDAFGELQPVRYAFIGVRAGVLALVLKAFVSMLKKCPRKAVSYGIALGAFILVAFAKINAVFVLRGSALLGLAHYLIERKILDKKEDE